MQNLSVFIVEQIEEHDCSIVSAGVSGDFVYVCSKDKHNPGLIIAQALSFDTNDIDVVYIDGDLYKFLKEYFSEINA